MKKFIIAATAALTLAGTLASTTTEAHAKKWGWGKGVGIIGLGVLGAAAASSYAYADDCRLVRVYNSYGEYIGRREICR
jgi:phosphoglycerate dehydrogenase-like enzyme